MRTITGLLLALSIVIISPLQTGAAEADWDSGPIETISGDYIYVNGQRGRHVLEMLEDCPWCQEGLVVLVRFQPPVRATIRPFEESSRGRILRALVIKDGREDR